MMYNFDKEHDMSGMNYNRSTNRHIANHTINPRWTTGKAYRPELNSPVTVIKADGTKIVEKPLNYDEINKVNKIKKKQPSKRARENRRAAEHNQRQKAKSLWQEQEDRRLKEIAKQNKERFKAQQPEAPKVFPVIVSRVKPVRKPDQTSQD
jgi:hypothetical protein